MSEYEKEFSHIVNCILYVLWDDKDKADYFERRLRIEILKVVHSFKLRIFAKVLDQDLWVEQGMVVVQKEHESCDKEKRKCDHQVVWVVSQVPSEP